MAGETSPHATAHTTKRADIQGLRAVAVFLVVAFHAHLPIPGGFIGVDVFFVISGFVIASMLVRQFERTDGLAFGRFYTRRLRRLLPALALLTTFMALSSIFLLSPLGPQKASARTGIAASLISANIQLSRVPGGGYFDLGTDTNAMLHSWSLSAEEQFYLVFPAFMLLAWVVARRIGAAGSRRRSTFVLVALGCGVSFVLSMYTTYHPSYRLGTTFAFYSAISRAWEFGAGALLALAAPLAARARPALATACGVVGVALITYGALAFDGATKFPGAAALVPVVGAALVIVAGTATDGPVARVLSIGPAVWIGDVSYGWYLWHWPLIVFAAALWPGRGWVLVLAGFGALVPTALSYRFLENPIRFNDRIVGRRVALLAGVCIVVPLLACGGLLVANHVERNSPKVKAYATAMRLHADRQRGCDQPEPLAERKNPACTWRTDADQARGHVYLVGDSNAGQFSEAAAAGANKDGFDLTVATSAGCPFVDLVVGKVGTPFDGEACRRNVNESVATLAKRKPALVIMAATANEYVNGDDLRLQDPRTGQWVADPERRAELWQQGLQSILERLADAGVPALVIHTIPQLGTALGDDWKGETCPAIWIYRGTCGGSESRSQIEQEQRSADRAERRAVVAVDGTAATDFYDEVCSPTTCATSRDGLIMYRDATHLSADGALTLSDRFATLITDQAR